jgi:hypothetical protein
MPTEKDKALRKKVMADNPQKMGESNADYQDRINKLFNAKNPDQPVAVGASTTQRREGQEKKKAKIEYTTNPYNGKRQLKQGSVYYTKDGKRVQVGRNSGFETGKLYDESGNLIADKGKVLEVRAVTRTDTTREELLGAEEERKKEAEQRRKAQEEKERKAKEKKAAAEKKAKELREEMDKVAADTQPMKRKDASVIKLAEPDTAELRMTKRSVPKAEEKEPTRSEKRMIRQGESGRADKAMGRAEARKTKAQSKATVKETKQEVSKLKKQVAGAEKAAKAKAKGDKRVARAKSKKEQLEARLKALRS